MPAAGQTKRTEAFDAQLLLLIKGGMPRTYAAEKLGIHRDTLREWRNADPELSLRIAEAEAEHLNELYGAAKGIALDTSRRDSASMLQWMLERRFFDLFGRRTLTLTGGKVTGLTIGDDKPASTALDPELDAEDRIRAIAALLDGAGASELAQGVATPAEQVHSGGPDQGREASRSNGHTNGVPSDPAP